ncbi:MAG TPA: hypothetical protein VF591_26905 [Pyrinomonadaceae bacterium]|jgi:hypothetical protein
MKKRRTGFRLRPVRRAVYRSPANEEETHAPMARRFFGQQVSYLNPVRHFSTIARGVLLKGVGLEVLYPSLPALTAFALVIVGASVWRFRQQLS